MKWYSTPPTEAQISRWLATALLASSILLGTAVVLAQSGSGAGDAPASPADPAHPASPTAPAAITPQTRPPADPRTAADIAMDMTIAERVRRALTEDQVTHSQPIAIEVTRGIANLSGTVKSRSIAARALSITRSVGGVGAVQDAMQVEEEGEESEGVAR